MFRVGDVFNCPYQPNETITVIGTAQHSVLLCHSFMGALEVATDESLLRHLKRSTPKLKAWSVYGNHNKKRK